MAEASPTNVTSDDAPLPRIHHRVIVPVESPEKTASADPPLPYIDHEPSSVVVIWLHGGAFTDGDETWSKSVTDFLKKHGMRVYTVNYPQGPDHPWPAAVEPLTKFAHFVKDKHPDSRIVMGGESSGAFFAYFMAVRMQWDFVALCPVLNPWSRYNRLGPDDFRSKRQLAFFRTKEFMQAASLTLQLGPRPLSMVVIVGKDDYSSDTNGFGGFGRRHTVEGTHDLCRNPSLQALALIAAGIANPQLPPNSRWWADWY